jgi:ABC-2 type transport system permease protein
MTAQMSAAPLATLPSAQAKRPGRFFGLLASEWTKIRSVRSTFWTMILFVVLTVGLTAGLTALVVHANGPNAPARDTRIIGDPVGFILGAGIGLGQLTICVLGVLVMSTEYSTGVIRASLLAVPRRLPMLIAKVTVFAVALLVLAEIVSFGSFFVGAPLLHGLHFPGSTRSLVTVTLSDHNVLRAVIGAGLYLTVLGLFALAIGGLIRHTAGGIATVIGAVLVLPILSGLLPSSWGAHINAYLPEQAGSLIYTDRGTAGQLLSSWEGLGVFCLWTLVLLALCGWLLQRRDA